MTREEAREKLLQDFHRTRYTEKVSVDAEALGVLLYGDLPKSEQPRMNIREFVRTL